MSTEVTLPALGESVTEGTISRWLKAVGETVEVDEPLLEVSTDKVDTEIPSPVAGTLLEVRFNEDDVAEVGAVLAVGVNGAPSLGEGPIWARALGFIGLILASINIFGGFLVTQRMLAMYRKKG